jgi:quercetin dioxygenase-like cupin family protein
MTRLARALAFTGIAMLVLPGTLSSQAQLDPKAVEFVKPGDIKFVRNAAGTQETAVLFGDPAKPGPYVVRLRWLPGNMSRPHFHPNDRFFVVIEGTWWMGSGEKFDPNSTVPVPAGTYVIHHAGQVHYDGAKDQPVVIQVWGMGPATATSAEKK